MNPQNISPTAVAKTASAFPDRPPPSKSQQDNNNGKNEEGEELQPCWICHDKNGVLLSNFCGCQGSLGRVHQSCLQTFVDSKEGDGGGERELCPTCKQHYHFIFFTRDGQPPPEVPKSPIASWFKQMKFLFFNFCIPIVIDTHIGLLELLLNWLIPSFLVGAVIFVGRSLAIEYWTERQQNDLQRVVSYKNNRHYYDYDAVYMRDNTVAQAMIVGAILMILRRRIKRGWAQIVNETTVRNQQQQQQHHNNNNNNNNQQQNQQQNGNNQHNHNEEEELAADGGLLPRNNNDDDDMEHNNDEDFEQFEENEDEDEEEFEEEEEIEEENEQQQGEGNNNNNNNIGEDGLPRPRRRRRQQRRRRGRKGGRTFDQILWKGVEFLQIAARYPHESSLKSIYETYTHDLPYMVVAMFVMTASPAAFFIYHVYHILYSYFKHIPPKLADMKNRYTEGGRRLKNESTDDDRDRYYLIYCYDAVFLYLLLSLILGITAHESLGVTNYSIASVNVKSNNTNSNISGSSSGTVTSSPSSFFYMPFDTRLMDIIFPHDHPLNPLNILFYGIFPRIFHVFHYPWNSVFHWMFGYLLAGVITVLESQIITPVFAAGCSLIFFRSINVSDEHATFRFMLIQLFDVSIYSGLAHCVKLFATYTPMIFVTVFTLVNSLRCATVLGFVISTKIDAALDSSSYDDSVASSVLSDPETLALTLWNISSSIFDGSINQHLHSMKDRFQEYNWEHPFHFQDNVTTVLNAIDHHIVSPTLETLLSTEHFYTIKNTNSSFSSSSLPSLSSTFFAPAIGDYSKGFFTLSTSFWICIVLVCVAGTAFYFLPYQYMILRRFLPLARSLAAKFALTRFLFDETQSATVDHFMEVSSELPVRGDNVIELPQTNVPINQTAVRRERFVDKDAIPSWHNVRIFVFINILFAKGLFDWICEVCVRWTLWSVAAASVVSINEVLPEDSKLGSLRFTQFIRLMFDPFLYILRVVGTVFYGASSNNDNDSGSSSSSTWNPFAWVEQAISYIFGASPLESVFGWSQNNNNSNNSDNNITETILSSINVTSANSISAIDQQQLSNILQMSGSSSTGMMNNESTTTDVVTKMLSSSEYGLNGMFLISAACVFCLANFQTELATSLGYVLVTPIALIMSVYELIKPAVVVCFSAEAMNSLIESVWRTAFGVRRVVVPRPEGYQQPPASGSASSRTTRVMKMAEFLERDLQEINELMEAQKKKQEEEEAAKQRRVRERRGYNLNDDDDNDDDANNNNNNHNNDDEEYLKRIEREQDLESNRLYKQLIDEIVALKNVNEEGMDDQQTARIKNLAQALLGAPKNNNNNRNTEDDRDDDAGAAATHHQHDVMRNVD